MKQKRVRKPKSLDLIQDLTGFNKAILYIFDSGAFGEVVGCLGFATNEISEIKKMASWLLRAADFLEQEKQKRRG